MSSVSCGVRTLLMVVAIAAPALSSEARASGTPSAAASTESRKHAALPVVGKATLTGVVRELATGLPIRKVALSTSDGQRYVTGEDGRFVFEVKSRPMIVEAKRAGFLPVSRTLAAGAPLSLDFNLDYAPAAVVKLVSGEIVTLDLDSSKFGYAQAFSGYVNADTATLCKEDGKPFRPNKSEFVKIVGPAVPATSACCTRGPALKATAEMKSGEKLTVFFDDTCYGYETVFLGLERTSGEARFLKFTDIAEISFP